MFTTEPEILAGENAVTDKKRTYTFYYAQIDQVELEARKRIRENCDVGRLLLGSVARDVICLAIKLSIKQIVEMTPEQYKQQIVAIKQRSKS